MITVLLTVALILVAFIVLGEILSSRRRQNPFRGEWFDAPGPVTLDDLDGSFRLNPNQPYTLKLFRGDADYNRNAIFPRGTLAFTLDNKQFHVHDGVTPGGAIHFEPRS